MDSKEKGTGNRLQGTERSQKSGETEVSAMRVAEMRVEMRGERTVSRALDTESDSLDIAKDAIKRVRDVMVGTGIELLNVAEIQPSCQGTQMCVAGQVKFKPVTFPLSESMDRKIEALENMLRPLTVAGFQILHITAFGHSGVAVNPENLYTARDLTHFRSTGMNFQVTIRVALEAPYPERSLSHKEETSNEQ